MNPRPQALLIGGSSSLGIELTRSLCCLGIPVALTTRNSAEFTRRLRDSFRPKWLDRIQVFDLDLLQCQEEDMKRLLEKIPQPTILVNLAAVYRDDARKKVLPPLWGRSTQDFEESLKVNLIGPWLSIQAVLPGMIANRYGRIVNVSSGMGRFEDLDPEGPFYRLSKLGLNGLSKIFSQSIPDSTNIKINSVCPGWFKSAMGGPQAPVSAHQASRGVLRACLLRPEGPNGVLLRGKRILSA